MADDVESSSKTEDTSLPSNQESTSVSEEESQSPMDLLQSLIQKFRVSDEEPAEKPEKLLDELNLDGIVKYIKSEKCKNIVVMCGAGISTSAGIPDFRSPGTGLYDNLQKYELSNPQQIFDIVYFQKNPQPFFALAKELYPGNFKPTPSHFFVKLLEEKGKLARLYTQNIDTLEREAGLSDEKIVEAHGTFHTSHCLDCKKEYSKQWMKERIFNDEVPRCPDCVDETDGLVKPDIVFFGEALPEKFFKNRYDDFQQCDLLIVMGTSLKVQPFASLVGGVRLETPRLLMNREKCGETDPMMAMLGFGRGMDFDSEDAYRDVACLGDCDDSCRDLCERLGWTEDFDRIVKVGYDKLEAPAAASNSNTEPGPSSQSNATVESQEVKPDDSQQEQASSL